MPIRNLDCPKYLECLDWAVKKNLKMPCEVGKCDPSTINFKIPEKEVKIMNTKKRCTKCGEEKPLEEFSKNISIADGLERWCKDCKKKQQQEYRDKHRDAIDGREIRKKRINPEKAPKIDDAIFLDRETIAGLQRAVAKKIITVIEKAFL